MPGPTKGHGSGPFSDIKRLKEDRDAHADQLKEHERLLKEHESRLDVHDEELAEIDADVVKLTNVSLTLSEICARGVKRQAARQRLREIRARRSK